MNEENISMTNSTGEKKKRVRKWDNPNPVKKNLTGQEIDQSTLPDAAANLDGPTANLDGPTTTAIGQDNASKPKFFKASSSISEYGFDYDINELAPVCRSILSLAITLDEIMQQTQATVMVKGRYIAPEDKTNSSERRLYLHIKGSSQQIVDAAISKIKSIISKTVSPINNTTTNSHNIINQQLFVQDKVFVGLDRALPAFNLSNRILGPSGSFLQHIQMTTGAKVSLRGRGSGFIEPTTGRESVESLHIHIQHTTTFGLHQGKCLSSNLIQTIQKEYVLFEKEQALLPPTINPGTASMLAGLQQFQNPCVPMPSNNFLFSNTFIPPVPNIPQTNNAPFYPMGVSPISKCTVPISSSSLLGVMAPLVGMQDLHRLNTPPVPTRIPPTASLLCKESEDAVSKADCPALVPVMPPAVSVAPVESKNLALSTQTSAFRLTSILSLPNILPGIKVQDCKDVALMEKQGINSASIACSTNSDNGTVDSTDCSTILSDASLSNSSSSKNLSKDIKSCIDSIDSVSNSMSSKKDNNISITLKDNKTESLDEIEDGKKAYVIEGLNFENGEIEQKNKNNSTNDNEKNGNIKDDLPLVQSNEVVEQIKSDNNFSSHQNGNISNSNFINSNYVNTNNLSQSFAIPFYPNMIQPPELSKLDLPPLEFFSSVPPPNMMKPPETLVRPIATPNADNYYANYVPAVVELKEKMAEVVEKRGKESKGTKKRKFRENVDGDDDADAENLIKKRQDASFKHPALDKYSIEEIKMLRLKKLQSSIMSNKELKNIDAANTESINSKLEKLDASKDTSRLTNDVINEEDKLKNSKKNDEERFLMPPPSLVLLPPLKSKNESLIVEKKKLKGALGSVAALYGSDEEDE